MSSKIAHKTKNTWRSSDVRTEEKLDFSSFLLKKKVLNGLKRAGFKRPSPVQVKAIPLGRCGVDMIVQSKSGTGKTCVFAVIALEGLSDIPHTQVLILTPTREIAYQSCSVIQTIGSSIPKLQCHCYIGGTSLFSDIESTKNCQIAVGTPGRIKQLIEINCLATGCIRLLVLDEADNMLHKSFLDDVNWIFHHLPIRKQVLATSATYPDALKEKLKEYMRNPSLVQLSENDLALKGLTQFYYVVCDHALKNVVYQRKQKILWEILNSVDFGQCLIFCNYITRVETICDWLNTEGYSTAKISSSETQQTRLETMEQLKLFQCKVLVTSDLTARGIDAANVDIVINFDLPRSLETYLHRIGRAGRYGAKAIAITLICDGYDEKSFGEFEVGGNFRAYPLPKSIPRNLSSWTQYKAQTAEPSMLKKSVTDIENLAFTRDVTNDGRNGNCSEVDEEDEIESESEESSEDVENLGCDTGVMTDEDLSANDNECILEAASLAEVTVPMELEDTGGSRNKVDIKLSDHQEEEVVPEIVLPSTSFPNLEMVQCHLDNGDGHNLDDLISETKDGIQITVNDSTEVSVDRPNLDDISISETRNDIQITVNDSTEVSVDRHNLDDITISETKNDIQIIVNDCTEVSICEFNGTETENISALLETSVSPKTEPLQDNSNADSQNKISDLILPLNAINISIDDDEVSSVNNKDIENFLFSHHNKCETGSSFPDDMKKISQFFQVCFPKQHSQDENRTLDNIFMKLKNFDEESSLSGSTDFTIDQGYSTANASLFESHLCKNKDSFKDKTIDATKLKNREDNCDEQQYSSREVVSLEDNTKMTALENNGINENSSAISTSTASSTETMPSAASPKIGKASNKQKSNCVTIEVNDNVHDSGVSPETLKFSEAISDDCKKLPNVEPDESKAADSKKAEQKSGEVCSATRVNNTQNGTSVLPKAYSNRTFQSKKYTSRMQSAKCTNAPAVLNKKENEKANGHEEKVKIDKKSTRSARGKFSKGTTNGFAAMRSNRKDSTAAGKQNEQYNKNEFFFRDNDNAKSIPTHYNKNCMNVPLGREADDSSKGFRKMREKKPRSYHVRTHNKPAREDASDSSSSNCNRKQDKYSRRKDHQFKERCRHRSSMEYGAGSREEHSYEDRSSRKPRDSYHRRAKDHCYCNQDISSTSFYTKDYSLPFHWPAIPEASFSGFIHNQACCSGSMNDPKLCITPQAYPGNPGCRFYRSDCMYEQLVHPKPLPCLPSQSDFLHSHGVNLHGEFMRFLHSRKISRR